MICRARCVVQSLEGGLITLLENVFKLAHYLCLDFRPANGMFGLFVHEQMTG